MNELLALMDKVESSGTFSVGGTLPSIPPGLKVKGVGLWYAYRRVHGVLYKRYVGKSAGLTLARLEETAVWLNEVW